MSPPKSSSFYDVLGVDRDATAVEIQRAYRRLARGFHPDVNGDPGAAERFREVVEAYSVLSDPQRRQEYDVSANATMRRTSRRHGEAAAGSARRAGRGPSGESWAWRPHADGTRAASGGFRATGLRADPDLGAAVRFARHSEDVEVTLTVEEAYRGARREVTVVLPAGRHTMRVDIPAGMIEGQRLRLTGAAAVAGVCLVVRMAPHPVYRLRKRDVTVDLPLSPWEATLGATVAVVTPGGRTALRVPPGTSSGQFLRVRGLGVPDLRGGAGDLFAQVQIVVPSSMTADERRLLEDLADASDFQPREGPRV